MTTMVVLGPYVAGEVPEQWEHTWRTDDGALIDLTGPAVIRWTTPTGEPVEKAASVSGSTTAYPWVDGDLAEPGTYRGELEVGNPALILRKVRWCMRVRPSPA